LPHKITICTGPYEKLALMIIVFFNLAGRSLLVTYSGNNVIDRGTGIYLRYVVDEAGIPKNGTPM
jgi:hypothetical protein